MHEKGNPGALPGGLRRTQGGIFSGETALKTYLDGVIAAVAANDLDGYSFTTDPLDATATASIVATLSAAKTDGQLLVYEGNPLFVAEADRAKLDYVVLDTEATTDITTLKLQVANATGYAGIAAERLLLAAAAGLRSTTRMSSNMPLSRKWPSGLYRSGRWPDLPPTTSTTTTTMSSATTRC